MSRALVVAGVHLDRAWVDLGPEVGDRLRQWSMDVLARAVEAGQERGTDQIIVLGDLFDRRRALPTTVEYAAAVLGSFSGSVVVVPGRRDWYGAGTPYTYGTWPANVTVIRDEAVARLEESTDLWVSGWTNAEERRVDGTEAADGSTVLRPSLSDPAALASRLAQGARLVTSGPMTSVGDGVTVVGPVVSASGSAEALLIPVGNPADTERIGLGDSPLRHAVIDVSAITSDRELYELAAAQVVDEEPIVLEFAGVLPSTVLPPTLAGWSWPTNVVLDEAGLRYEAPPSGQADRTTLGEFLQAMADAAASPREKHVATALALQALTETGD